MQMVVLFGRAKFGSLAHSLKGIAGVTVALKANAEYSPPGCVCCPSFVGLAEQDNPKIQEVLRLFLKKLEFKDASLDEALRSMVVRFRLPGEAQQMDRFVPTRANF